MHKIRHTLKILQQMLQDFQSVSDHFWALCIKGYLSFAQIRKTHPKILHQPNLKAF